eukprot:SAG31_NODE_12855_length_911_cov_1.299261_1_plen_83_part_00
MMLPRQADTFFHRQHFAELTYKFATDQARYRSFWQTPIVHYGNLFDLPLLCQARYAMISVSHVDWAPGAHALCRPSTDRSGS